MHNIENHDLAESFDIIYFFSIFWGNLSAYSVSPPFLSFNSLNYFHLSIRSQCAVAIRVLKCARSPFCVHIHGNIVHIGCKTALNLKKLFNPTKSNDWVSLENLRNVGTHFHSHYRSFIFKIRVFSEII